MDGNNLVTAIFVRLVTQDLFFPCYIPSNGGCLIGGRKSGHQHWGVLIPSFKATLAGTSNHA
ncbi:hypothetical protein Hanom_Chr11g01054011 [Helianthus anomalus]